MKTQHWLTGVMVVGVTGLLAACGESDKGASFGDGGAGGRAGGPTSSGTSGSSGSDLGVSGAGTGTGAGPDDGGACAGEKSKAELVPLDMYIMLDKSGSMDDATATGESKWDAVTGALRDFFASADASELGAGLQYFPLGDSGAAGAACQRDAECGASGRCLVPHACSDGGGVGSCDSDADCGSGATCEAAGLCSQSFRRCTDLGASCGAGEGTCDAFFTGTCLDEPSCEVGRYATPEVAIGPLQGNAAALVGSIDGKEPGGGTPTQGALSGAIQYAHGFAEQNPTHKVVAVLVTDGLPSNCAVQDADGLAEIAAAGLSGTPSVPTFTIGVFAPGDPEGRDTVNAIAEGGGTSSAFLVDPTQDVSRAFLDALNAIRGQTLACEYQIPRPSGGQEVEYGQVNVEYTPPDASASSTLFYVANDGACDIQAGGWHYDVDPATGATPTKIVICPASCEALKAGGEIEISVGCKTEVGVPR